MLDTRKSVAQVTGDRCRAPGHLGTSRSAWNGAGVADRTLGRLSTDTSILRHLQFGMHRNCAPNVIRAWVEDELECARFAVNDAAEVKVAKTTIPRIEKKEPRAFADNPASDRGGGQRAACST